MISTEMSSIALNTRPENDRRRIRVKRTSHRSRLSRSPINLGHGGVLVVVSVTTNVVVSAIGVVVVVVVVVVVPAPLPLPILSR